MVWVSGDKLGLSQRMFELKIPDDCMPDPVNAC